MEKRISTKVTTLLYNDMTKEELNSLDIEELHLFWGVLHHWQELTLKRIEEMQESTVTQ